MCLVRSSSQPAYATLVIAPQFPRRFHKRIHSDMKRAIYPYLSPFQLILYSTMIVILSLSWQPPAVSAQIMSTCTDEVSLSFTGLSSSQAVTIEVTYSTGQTDTLNETTDGSGDLSVTFDRISNDPYSITAQVVDGSLIASTAVSCPSLTPTCRIARSLSK